MNDKLTKLGNTETVVSLEKIKKHIPPFYYEKIYPDLEMAKASGDKFYAIANESDKNYYVSHPISEFPGLKNGTEVNYGYETTQVSFKDDLGEEVFLPKWIVDILIPIVSKEGQQKVVVGATGTTKNYAYIKNLLGQKSEYKDLEFTFVNVGNVYSDFQHAVYNTKINNVGNGYNYHNDKISYYKIDRSGKLAVASNGNFIKEGVVFHSGWENKLSGIVSEYKFETITKNPKTKEEEEKKLKEDKEREEEVELISESGEAIKVKLGFLMDHVPVWGFSNFYVRDVNSNPPQELAAKDSVLTELVCDKRNNHIEVVKRYQKKPGETKSFRQISKKIYFSNIKVDNFTKETSVSLSKEEVEAYAKETITLTDLFGKTAEIPKWIYEDCFTENDKENFVFYYEVSVPELRSKLAGKKCLLINPNRKGNTNEITLIRVDDGKDIPFHYEEFKQLKDPMEINWMVINKEKRDAEMFIGGLDKKEFPNEEVLRKNYLNSPSRYKAIVQAYNTNKKESIFQNKVKNKILSIPGMKDAWIFSSKEEYLKNKTKLGETRVPLAGWFEKGEKFYIDYYARYSSEKNLVYFQGATDGTLAMLKTSVSEALNKYSEYEGKYHKTETVNYIKSKIKDTPIEIKFSPSKDPFHFCLETEKISFIGEKGEALETIRLPADWNTFVRWIDAMVESYYKAYLPKGNTIPQFLSSKDIYTTLRPIKVVNSKEELTLEPYGRYLFETGDLYVYDDEGVVVHKLNLLNSKDREQVGKVFLEQSTLLALNGTKFQTLYEKYIKFCAKTFKERPIVRTSIFDKTETLVTPFGIFEVNVRYPTKTLNQNFESQLEALAKTEFVSYNEYEENFRLPKEVLDRIPDQYKKMYSLSCIYLSNEINFNDSIWRDSPFAFLYSSITGSFLFLNETGKVVKLAISEEEMFAPTKETISKIDQYFDYWKSMHSYISSIDRYYPKTVEKHITDPQIEKLIGNKENGITIGDDGIQFFVNGKPAGWLNFSNRDNSIIEEYFTDFKNEISSFKKVADVLKADSKIVAKRLIVKKINDVSCAVLLTLARSKQDIPAIEKFLRSEVGTTAVGLVSSLLLKSASNYFDAKYRPLLNEIADEMRISAETNISLSVVNFIQEAVVEKLNSKPEFIRVMVDSFEEKETLRLDKSSETEFFFAETQQKDKMVN